MTSYIGSPIVQPDRVDWQPRVMVVSSDSPLRVRESQSATGDLAVVNAVPDRRHAVGDRVLVAQLSGTLYITAALTPRPMLGVVRAVSGGSATVAAGSREWVLPLGLAQVAVGDSVAMLWGPEGGVVLAKQSAAGAPTADPGAVPPASAPLGGLRTAVLRATQTDTYRGGVRRGIGMLVQGFYAGGLRQANLGLICYGDVWGALVGKRVQSAFLDMTRSGSEIGTSSRVGVHVWVHAYTSLPGAFYQHELRPPEGVPARLGFHQSAVLDVTAQVQALLVSGGQGLAVAYDGSDEYAAFAGVGASNACRLTVTYQE